MAETVNLSAPLLAFALAVQEQLETRVTEPSLWADLEDAGDNARGLHKALSKWGEAYNEPDVLRETATIAASAFRAAQDFGVFSAPEASIAQTKPAPTVCRPSPGIDPERGTTLNIDFDGTVVTHAFPSIGHDIGAVPVLRELVEAGHHLILFTMRSDEYLDAAVEWFAQQGLPLYGINTNPTQTSWTQSPKSYARKMIDDSAVCAPLLFDPSVSDRPFIDWVRMRELLVEHGLLEGGAR